MTDGQDRASAIMFFIPMANVSCQLGDERVIHVANAHQTRWHLLGARDQCIQ